MVAIQKAGELLKFSVGDEMRKHIDESRTPANLSSLGELIGGIFGGAVKTLGS